MRSFSKLARRAAALAIPGAMVLGTTCASEIRDSVVAASLDYVESTATLVLETFIPVEDFVSDGE
jgi:hypothetical protein